ncbi:antA/AntB antirepressor family protein [Comamonas thiooxydans]|uniref:antA/AntB antirepressor family protein n=1 Tax=Comamonas thiooxydans TaxID=363952 RepID=UPI0018A35FFC|nr:antA/AntB antirepressor family protein [Comamonas thiooxydans]QOQ83842.1 antA/AntB antirepressor family protein [Comamonas thiooxydans]
MSNSTLIPVFAGAISGTTTQLCEARTLHAFMQVRRDFSNWIKGRIRKFGFMVGEDFITVSRSPELASGNRGASIDYHLTLDMAKELAMVENNEQGRAARRYFIECERKALETTQAQPQQMRLDYDRISPAQAQDLKQIVQAIVEAGLQAHGETWKRLQNKFKVNSYLALHPDQYEAARSYLIAKLPNGYAGGEVQEALPELGINLFSKHAMQHAQINAASYMRKWREQQAQGKDAAIAVERLPADVLSGLVAEQLMQQRWLVGYDYGRGGLLAQPVGNEEFVCNWAQLARGIACGDRQATTAELVDLASACNQQLVQRMGNPALVLAV